MSDTVELHINAAKKAELEFDVRIQGISSDEPMDVRIAIKNIDTTGSLVFDCEHIDDDKWCVKFPVLKDLLKNTSYDFVLEVIIDGYYFAPAEGKINLITNPTVDMNKKKSRPKVQASFTVKQEEEVVEERTAQAAGDASDDSAPTNALLEPEFDPTLPQVAEEDEKDSELEREDEVQETFNPMNVAESIIKNTVGKVQAPTSKGFLFQRASNGKPVVKGLEDKATKQRLEEKAAVVKQILSGSES